MEGQGFFRQKIDNELITKFLPNLYTESIKEQKVTEKWREQAE